MELEKKEFDSSLSNDEHDDSLVRFQLLWVESDLVDSIVQVSYLKCWQVVLADAIVVLVVLVQFLKAHCSGVSLKTMNFELFEAFIKELKYSPCVVAVCCPSGMAKRALTARR